MTKSYLRTKMSHCPTRIRQVVCRKFFKIKKMIVFANQIWYNDWVEMKPAQYTVIGVEKSVKYKLELPQKISFSRQTVFYILFGIITVFLFWKCRYGFGNLDESFYITIPYRFVQGDKIFFHEWHLSQTSSVLLIPAVRLQLLFFGNMEGVILHFRYLFVLIWSASSLFFFQRLKCFSGIGAAFASLVFMLYAPYSIMALSYNSMGLLNLTLATVILITAKNKLRWQYAVSGVFYAAAVLCCPFLPFLYILCSVLLLLIVLLGRSDLPLNTKRLKEIWCFETLGIVFSACGFLIYMLRRITFGQLFKMIPYLLSDSQHSNLSFYFKTKFFFKSIMKFAGIYILIAVALLVIVKIMKKHRKLCLAAMYAVMCFFILNIFLEYKYLNHIMFPMNIFGFYCAVDSKSKKVKSLFYGMFLPGVIYQYCLNYTSNQLFYAISSASALSAVASVVMIVLYTQEVFKGHSISIQNLRVSYATAAIAALMCVQLGAEGYLRYHTVFWEVSIETQTEMITTGPEKGIFAPPKKCESYNALYDDVSSLGLSKDQKLLSISNKTWLYLCSNARCASYAAFLNGSGATRINPYGVEKLDMYYSVCKDKKPDIIFIEADFSEFFTQVAKDPCTVTITKNNNMIVRMLDDQELSGTDED